MKQNKIEQPQVLFFLTIRKINRCIIILIHIEAICINQLLIIFLMTFIQNKGIMLRLFGRCFVYVTSTISHSLFCSFIATIQPHLQFLHAMCQVTLVMMASVLYHFCIHHVCQHFLFLIHSYHRQTLYL